TELGRVKAGTGTEAREAAATGKERLERLVQPAENLLLGAEGPSGELRRSAADSLQLVCLHLVRHGDVTTAPGIDALFQSGVIELAKVRKHLPERSGLRPVRLDAVFVAQDQ